MTDIDARYVMVGEARVKVNEWEWNASIAEKGQTVWFRHRVKTGFFHRNAPLSPWKRGTYTGSMFYDGVIAYVFEDDPDDLVRHTLFLDLGDELLLEEPT